MKIRCGTDIIEIERIRKAIENLGDKFIHEIFTEQEIAYCESKKAQKYQHYAARFAAKEATYKAISDSLGNTGIEWLFFEVIKEKSGKPRIKIHYDITGLESIDVSISHSKLYASANVVAIFE